MIDLIRRMDATQEAMAGSILKDWFVDYGPARAKASGCAPLFAAERRDLFPDALNGGGKPEGKRTCTRQVISRIATVLRFRLAPSPSCLETKKMDGARQSGCQS